MLEAGVFKGDNAAYLEKALKVVPPVRDLKIKVPKGRRARYPAEPEVVEEIGKRYGVANNLDRLVTALNKLPPLTKS